MAKCTGKAAVIPFVAAVLLCWMLVPKSATSQSGAIETKPLTGLVPDHVTISVDNIERVSAWYVRVLGFDITSHPDTNPDFLNWHLTIPGYRIDLIKYKGSSRPSASAPLYLHQGWIHIAFNVPDLPEAWKALQAMGTDVTADKDPQGIPTRLIVHDPENNEVEFFKRP